MSQNGQTYFYHFGALCINVLNFFKSLSLSKEAQTPTYILTLAF